MLGTNVFAQKVRPDSSTSTKGYLLGSTINEEDILKAYDDNIETFTEIKTPELSIATTISPFLNLKYTPNPVPADENFYLKIDFSNAQILDNIASGYVGNFLNQVVSALLGGVPQNFFEFKNNNTTIFEGKTHEYSRTSADKMRVVKDTDGNSYFKFSLGEQFDEVSIQTRASGLLVAPRKWIRVYDSYYYSNSSECPGLFTYADAVDAILTLGSSAGVRNTSLAIDNNLKSSSVFGKQSLLSLGVEVSMEQFFELPKPTNSKLVKIKMEMPSKLLDIDVASGVEVNFYNGKTKLSSQMIDSSIVGIDLTGLINDKFNVPFSFLATPPTDSTGNRLYFDKISISVKKPVSLEVISFEGDLKIYDVAFVDVNPEIKYVCTKEEILNNIRTEKFLLTDLIPNYSVNAKYIVIDSNHNLIVDGYNIPEEEDTFSTSAENIKLPLGTYYIKGIDSPNYCPNEYASFTVRKDTQYRISGKLSVSMPLVSENSNIVDASHVFNTSDYSVVDYDDALNNVTAAYSPIQIFRESDNVNVTGIPLSFPQIGTYNFYAKTHRLNNPNCEIVRRITVYVYDQAECDYRYQKLGANTEEMKTISLLGIPLGGSSDSAKTIDSSQQENPNLYQYDLSTHGSIFNVISLLGIGTTSQDLIFKENNGSLKQITPGTPLTIKLGQDYSVLQVLGGITIRPIDTFGQAVGPLLSVDEFDLANVLVGDNVFEFTFIPQGNSGENIWYSGVRINLGSVLGLGNTLKVYGAYIDERIAIGDSECNPNIVINGAESRVRDQDGNLVTNLDTRLLLNKSTSDVLYGTRDIGLGVATALSSILYPYHAADAIEAPGTDLHGTPNLETGTTFNASVGALNAMTLTVKFKEIARPGDKVRIVLGHEGGSVLDANVLGSALTAQRYMGSVAIGEPVTIEAGSLIDLDLLSLINPQASNKYAYMLEAIGAPFDRVELQIGNIVNAKLLAPKLVVYDMSLLPYFEFESLDETTTLCTSVPFEIEKMDPCTSYDISFSYPTLTSGQISAWNNIQGSEISIANEDIDKIQYRLQMRNILNEYNNNGTLYMKVITKRQGCIYGDPQYLKVKLASCGAIVNPMIRTRAGR